MIVGVDHIALACVDLETGQRALDRLGLSERFVDRAVANAPQKRPLLSDYGPLHDIAVYDPQSGAAIELTAHNVLQKEARNGFTPVLEVTGPAAAELADPDGESKCVTAAFGEGFVRHALQELDTYCYLRAGHEDSCLRAGVLAVADLEASLAFFTSGLAGKTDRQGVENGRRWAVVKLPALMPKWRLELLLVAAEGAATNENFLDNAGWPCLACLTTSIEGDAEKLRQAAARHVGEIFHLSVNGKALRILLAAGPNGELIELIEISKK
ncbi:VOC family protein [Roseibium sp. Sym1]|uniref:VOC family protein n=1 Tax=Roseibium sp. Sym1 TaxID=3016006 RepID=UPI0022B46422|nr:VOC family protein [Roseibium sp. Sym1]